MEEAVKMMEKVFGEVAGPEVPLKGAEMALKLSAPGKLWNLAGVIAPTKEEEARVDGMMCTMAKPVWRWPGQVGCTAITLPHSHHGLGMPMPSREVRMRRWGVVMAVWRCRHTDMKERMEGWFEEARERMKVKKGVTEVTPHYGNRGFMG